MSHNEKVSNILSIYALSNDYDRLEGQEWYSGDAWNFSLNLGWQVAANLGQLAQEIDDRHWSKFVAAVIAVLSPKKEWRINKAIAYAAVQAVLAGQPVVGHYGAQTAKVSKLYRYFLINRGTAFSDAAVLSIISKPDAKKTRNFYLNITGNQVVVTVDGHAANIALHGTKRLSIDAAPQPDGAVYDLFADAYTDAAKQLGITPPVLQATTWVTYRRLAIVK